VKFIKLNFLIIVIFISNLHPQIKYDWITLPNAPVVNRFNDVYFVTPDTGWIVNGDGEIYKTTDDGESWQLLYKNSDSHFRSVGFFNSQYGYAGNVGVGEFGTIDSTALYKTTDGGTNWEPVVNFVGTKPTGLCGMFVLNDSVIYSVGRVRGPAFIIKTTNGGETWYSKNMDAYAAGLIDAYFFNKDSGYVVGLTNSVHSSSGGIILFTSDAGATWETKYITSRQGEWCWKINFPSPQVGYVSIQRNSGSPVNFIKTTDGGNTWFEMEFSSTPYFVQGIGFANDTLGWIGGNNSLPSYETTDGGETWHEYPIGNRLNRFRMLNDTLGYAVGSTVHKFIAHNVTFVKEDKDLIPAGFMLYQNYPNPFNPATSVEYRIGRKEYVTLKVYDVLGREISELVNEELLPGIYSVEWNAEHFTSGTYFYKLTAGEFIQTKKMILLR
jgi:photosystem II stability/assembly factor-like uncharacterized protein